MLARRSLAVWIGLLLTAVAGAEAAPRPYVYRVLEYEVVDGDTLRTTLDLGFRLRIELLARLDGVDAPEATSTVGQEVAAFVTQWCARQRALVVESTAQDKYSGRYVARLYGDQECLNEVLLAAGVVRPYAGSKRPAWSEAELQKVQQRLRVLSSGSDVNRVQRSPSREAMVYVTPTGKKYHERDCRFVNDQARAMPLAEAARQYEPCKVCRPPLP